MILKPPQKTQQLKQLEIMQDRCLDISPASSEAFGRELAGYLGEKSLPYYVHLTGLASHYDLYGLRLEYDGHHFQMDGLFLFPHLLLITEVKHLKGKLWINEAEQLIQLKEMEEKSYPHPLQQANLQKEQFLSLLADHGYRSIPVFTLAIFTHQEANLSIDHPDILPAQQFPFRLKELMREFTTRKLETDQLLQLGKKLMAMHRERPISYLQPTVEVLQNIRRGVFCPKCKPLIMKWTYGTWECRKCGYKDKNAHVAALIDFAYLFGFTITNKQARWFLLLDSIYTTSRLLRKLNIETQGGNKNKKYFLRSLFKDFKR